MLKRSLLLLFGLIKHSLLIVLPSLVVYLTLSRPAILISRGESILRPAIRYKVHDLFPNTTWNNIKTCGEFFNEQKEFFAAKSCANIKVWPKTSLPTDLVIPRCFVVSAGSPDIVLAKDKTFNFVPVIDIFGLGAVVGVYEASTHTVFLVENIDLTDIYKHELQHYFLHIHDPASRGGGHDQPIWDQCQPKYYTPSIRAKVQSQIIDY